MKSVLVVYGTTEGQTRKIAEFIAEAWSWSPGISSREFAEETTGSPKFLGNLHCPFARVLTDAGRSACTRPIECSSVALGM